MIYIIEGPDGTGKTTLAHALAKKTNAAILHCSYNKEWNMRAYHKTMFTTAEVLNQFGINTILDRWAPSEAVYSKVFRDGESYNTNELIQRYASDTDVKWIYCWNENVVDNHIRNSKNREEMFNDMAKIAEEFEDYINSSKLPWVSYNFNQQNLDEFVKELTNE